VLGHKHCAAIEAVCEAGEKPLHVHLLELQKHTTGIRKQVLDTHGHPTSEQIDSLCRANARKQALNALRESEVLHVAQKKGDLRVMFGSYDMETGAVEFFSIE
jgi:carbonic anhydrase